MHQIWTAIKHDGPDHLSVHVRADLLLGVAALHLIQPQTEVIRAITLEGSPYFLVQPFTSIESPAFSVPMYFETLPVGYDLTTCGWRRQATVSRSQQVDQRPTAATQRPSGPAVPQTQ